MKKFAAICFLLLVCQTYGQETLTRILFILDASNSMNAPWTGNQTRIEAAKELLAQSVDSLKGTPNLEIGLRVYGHQSPITANYQDCNDTKLEVPFGPDNYDNIKFRIRSIEAKGTTPIARSLEAAAGDFPDATSRNVIILITDGLEACDNDPCVIAKKLKDKGVKVTPFVIGLGMDLSYLDKFNCIGTYAEAESKDAFRRVLTNVVNKVLVNTTIQINLNDINKKPTETNVTMFLFEAGTKNMKYTFMHTMNRFNNPDTVFMDPAIKYDLFVNTIPPVGRKDISILKNTHNTIIVDAPQGFIKARYTEPTKTYPVALRVMEQGKSNTLNVQNMNASEKYIVGKYDLEILTLPRIYKSIEVNQSSTTYVDIPPPGNFSFKNAHMVVAQIFLIKDNEVPLWVCNLQDGLQNGVIQLQPGKYRLVYRQKNLKSTSYTTSKDFMIYSNKTTSISM